MKNLLRKVATVALVVGTALSFAGCSTWGDSGGLTGLGQVARNTCRQPMPVYTKGAVSHHYTK